MAPAKKKQKGPRKDKFFDPNKGVGTKKGQLGFGSGGVVGNLGGPKTPNTPPPPAPKGLFGEKNPPGGVVEKKTPRGRENCPRTQNPPDL